MKSCDKYLKKKNEKKKNNAHIVACYCLSALVTCLYKHKLNSSILSVLVSTLHIELYNLMKCQAIGRDETVSIRLQSYLSSYPQSYRYYLFGKNLIYQIEPSKRDRNK